MARNLLRLILLAIVGLSLSGCYVYVPDGHHRDNYYNRHYYGGPYDNGYGRHHDYGGRW